MYEACPVHEPLTMPTVFREVVGTAEFPAKNPLRANGPMICRRRRPPFRAHMNSHARKPQ